MSSPVGDAEVEEPLRLAYLADPNSIHTRRWIRFFAERGHDVTLLVVDGDPILPGLPPGIAVRQYRRGGRHRLPLLASRDLRTALRAALGELDADILHAHTLTPHGWLARISGFHPYVVTLWGSDILLAPHRSRRTRLKAMATLRGAELVTVAAEHIGEAARELGARPDRIRFIHFGVDTARFKPECADPEVYRRLGLDGRRVVLSPRSLTPLYRHESVLRAAARLPRDVVVVSGALRADQDHLATLEALADELGLGDRFIILPEFSGEDIPALFASADVVVSVPLSDGSPLTILEAMASGTPIVASDLPGPRGCLVNHPELVVPVDDPEALAIAINRALELDPDRRRELGGALRRVVEDRYEYRENMLAMERAYRELAGRPRPRTRS